MKNQFNNPSGLPYNQPKDNVATPADMSAMAGGNGMPMTSESWMQVAARAAQLATQLREMENMGLVGAASVANPIRSLPMPSAPPVAGYGNFLPQLSQGGDTGNGIWATSRGTGSWMGGITNGNSPAQSPHWNVQGTPQVRYIQCAQL